MTELFIILEDRHIITGNVKEVVGTRSEQASGMCGAGLIIDNQITFFLRISCISHKNIDISIAESHIMKTETLSVEGYHWFSHNRDIVHVNARKGFGGVEVLIRTIS